MWSQLVDQLCTALLPEEFPESCIPEMKAADQRIMHNLLRSGELMSVSSVILCERYSTIHKLYRVTDYVLKSIDFLRKRTTSLGLTAQDLS